MKKNKNAFTHFFSKIFFKQNAKKETPFRHFIKKERFILYKSYNPYDNFNITLLNMTII